jgi:hypothetical protein
MESWRIDRLARLESAEQRGFDAAGALSGYPQTSPQASAKTVEMWTICCAQNARFLHRTGLVGPGFAG